MKIGIIGSGQLGRMLALAGYPLGCSFLMYDRVHDAPGGQVAPIMVGEFDDLRQLRGLARRVDAVTFDWENVPVSSVRAIADLLPVWPPPAALEVSQDRLAEKTLFRRLGIPTAPCAALGDRRGLERAVRRIGLPGVLKTRRMGYDGKGQAVVRTAGDVDEAWRQLGGQPLIYEGFVHFTREVSLVAVRGQDGAVACYPIVENVHEAGILSHTLAPHADARLQALAERHMKKVLARFRYVGVLCIEFFVERGRLVANEMAPRVHNSGHWTIEGAETSQFENHVRAIAGLPLGATRPRGHAAMVNFIGTMPAARDVLAIEGAHLHDYGKQPRPGRKLGHATVLAPTRAARDRAWRRLLSLKGR
jgi:5-(carboxyamino)imidazole ribonucleotide synthase